MDEKGDKLQKENKTSAREDTEDNYFLDTISRNPGYSRYASLYQWQLCSIRTKSVDGFKSVGLTEAQLRENNEYWKRLCVSSIPRKF